MKAPGDFYRLLPTSFGDLGMVWTGSGNQFRLRRVFLPALDKATHDLVVHDFPQAATGSGVKADKLAEHLQMAMGGKAAFFNLEDLDLSRCTSFQRTVLSLCFCIPRGKVMTYGTLAEAAHVPRGARAAGMVMAGNPFPLIIPCHRVVRSNGALGGFGGGTAMKKSLLKNEGVIFDDRERVVPDGVIRNWQATGISYLKPA